MDVSSLRLRSPREAAAAAAVAAVLVCGLVWKLSGGGGVEWTPEPWFGQPRLQVWWRDLHSTLAAEVQQADVNQGWDVVFYGDSITEALRGTTSGSPCSPCEEAVRVFTQHMAAKYSAGVLGVSGDQTGHLMFRLTHGEMPRIHHPKVVVVLTGTNDIGYVSKVGGDTSAMAGTAETVVKRVAAIVQLLAHDLPGSQIVLLGLLPRGDRDAPDPYAQPSKYTAALDQINEGYRRIASKMQRVHFVDCGGPLLLMPDGARLDEIAMPDGLHPSATGYEELFAGCWDDAIARLVTGTG